MADEECPHGLEREWCTLCKATLPTGVKRLTPRPAVRARRSPTSPMARPAAPVARRPAEGFADLRKVLFHASAYEAWPLIAASGLRTAAQLAGADHVALGRLRGDDVALPSAVLRDQRPMIRANIEQHLVGTDLAGWLALVNERVFLYAQQRSMLAKPVPAGGQDVLVFDTRRLLAAAAGRVEVLTDELAAPEPWARCPCRGPDTFRPLTTYRGDPADVFEVAVVGGIEDVSGLVTRVVRHHPDRSTEVLVS
ncbi:MAG: DUF7002 family protein [Acidimicrobiales bacterium]